MKPIVIIAIAVVCSIVAVLGVSVGWEMYQVHQYEKGVALGLDVEQKYQTYINKIEKCIPDNVICYNNLMIQFNNEFDRLAKKHGFSPSEPSIQEYNQMIVNFFKIEYDYQNNIYDINQEYSNSYYDSYYYDENPLVSYWSNAYRMAVAQTQMEVAETIENKNDNNSFRTDKEIPDCPEGISVMECMSKYSPGTCPSKEHHLIGYEISSTYRHFADKDGNGYYCEYYNESNDKMLYFDDG